MWLFVLALVVPGFITFALGMVFRVFWVLTTLFVVGIILVGAMQVWATVSCASGNETACLHQSYATYTIEGMTANQVKQRQQDYDAYPMADRNNVVRRWFLLRTERIGGAVYATRQPCFGTIWPKSETLGGLHAFQKQCFDRQIISPGPRYGDHVPPRWATATSTISGKARHVTMTKGEPFGCRICRRNGIGRSGCSTPLRLEKCRRCRLRLPFSTE